ncbi:sulfotransferase family protein [Azospirillum sp. RWY-5-1]|uniref:Sulfotransferase family protein n=1 Tax=Azospirillum oleiclasticum TaxID=2735135 RepID=A0ABX2TH13_9PROT|nr:sulfotransferase family protein [Azospirillum oleiclasticum]NYZ15558.1 sulfotransferase family protein [Azospirillum oleiclasticum]NYZ22581.1 sulfotransferase family protein [Azospirillum oleiclasticum]
MSMDLARLTNLERLITLVHQGHRELDTWPLELDGVFQRRAMRSDEAMRETVACLAAGFRKLRPAEFPVLYCGWGKARVGSTALNNLFGMAGIPSYYQPVKALLRQVLADSERTPWEPPAAAVHSHVFTKETQGPYSVAECLFIPLQALVEAGYPADRLHLIVLDRDPARSLASWLAKLAHLVPAEVLQRHYVIAALNARRVKAYARSHGIPMTHYVYEASKEPVDAVRALFRRLGLAARFTEAAVMDWREQGTLAPDKSRIHFPNEPAIYHVPGLHGADTAYRFRNGGTTLTDEQAEFLVHSGVPELYRESVLACIDDLGFDNATAKRLFGVVRAASDAIRKMPVLAAAPTPA